MRVDMYIKKYASVIGSFGVAAARLAASPWEPNHKPSIVAIAVSSQAESKTEREWERERKRESGRETSSGSARLVADMSTGQSTATWRNAVCYDRRSTISTSTPLSHTRSASLSLCLAVSPLAGCVFSGIVDAWCLGDSSTNSFKMVSVPRKILFFYNFSSALICRAARLDAPLSGSSSGSSSVDDRRCQQCSVQVVHNHDVGPHTPI